MQGQLEQLASPPKDGSFQSSRETLDSESNENEESDLTPIACTAVSAPTASHCIE